MGKLPQRFLDRMKILLKGEYDEFIASYEQPRVYGLRMNPLKIDGNQWRDISPMGETVTPIPWAKDGFYYKEEDRPGRHAHYHAGLYYIQEPSAMLPVELLDVQPGHRVLDLCAAPGGKSTQIAGKLKGQGILVSNDLATERTKVLAKNIELAGVRNAIILNESPSSLLKTFRGWFHRILIDAPCSGEGMFRKDESMAGSWESHSVERCSVMQRDILKDAAGLLAPGGMIVYSTCTFSPEENEGQIAAFLLEHPEFEVAEAHPPGGISAGRPDWLDAESADALGAERAESLSGTVRLWPHRLKGEGHYAAVLRKSEKAAPIEAIKETPEPGKPSPELRKGERKMDRKRGSGKSENLGKSVPIEEDPCEAWNRYARSELRLGEGMKGMAVNFGSMVFLSPPELPALDRLRVIRAGWYVGDAKKGRFKPSQALAMGLKREEAARSVDWRADSEQAVRYLRGETLFLETDELELAADVKPKGYVLVCVDGYPVGWGKYVDGMLRNELSSGWRVT